MDVTPLPDSAAASIRPRIPWWVVALDVVTVVSALLFVSNVAFGGFRLALGPMRITANSAWRVVLLIGIAAAGLRHWMRPRPSLPAELVGRLRRSLRSEAARVVLPVFVLSRGMVVAIGFLGVVLIGYPKVDPPFRLSRNELINLPVRWDAGWYLQIALDGYRYKRSARAHEQQNIAFFPAYPLLSRTAAALLGLRPARVDEPRGNEVDWLYVQHRRVVFGGMIVALGSFAWALVYLFRLGRELVDIDAAEGAVLMASAWPYAIFFNALYSEALFLLVSVAAFYHLRKGEHTRAAIWGLVAGLSRPNGFLLSLPLGLLVLESSWRAARTASTSTERSTRSPSDERRRRALGLAAAAAPVVGMLLYSAFLYDLTGRPLAWMEAHQAWGRVSTDVNALLTDRMTFIAEQGLYTYSIQQPVELLNAVPTFLALALDHPDRASARPAYALLLLVYDRASAHPRGVSFARPADLDLFPLFLFLGWLLGGTRAHGSPRVRRISGASGAPLLHLAAVLLIASLGQGSRDAEGRRSGPRAASASKPASPSTSRARHKHRIDSRSLGYNAKYSRCETSRLGRVSPAVRGPSGGGPFGASGPHRPHRRHDDGDRRRRPGAPPTDRARCTGRARPDGAPPVIDPAERALSRDVSTRSTDSPRLQTPRLAFAAVSRRKPTCRADATTPRSRASPSLAAADSLGDARLELALLLDRLGRHADAQAHFQAIVAAPMPERTAPRLFRLARALVALGQARRANGIFPGGAGARARRPARAVGVGRAVPRQAQSRRKPSSCSRLRSRRTGAGCRRWSVWPARGPKAIRQRRSPP